MLRWGWKFFYQGCGFLGATGFRMSIIAFVYTVVSIIRYLQIIMRYFSQLKLNTLWFTSTIRSNRLLCDLEHTQESDNIEDKI